MKYKLTCTSWNTAHVKFNLFDPTGANCGNLCIHALDVVNFLQNSWRGDILWNGNMPEFLWDPEKYPAHSRHLKNPMKYESPNASSVEGFQATAMEEQKAAEPEVAPILFGPDPDADAQPQMDDPIGKFGGDPYFKWNENTKAYERQ
jgi:hypothetical protein